MSRKHDIDYEADCRVIGLAIAHYDAATRLASQVGPKLIDEIKQYMTQREIAAHFGLSDVYVCQLKTGFRAMPPERIKGFCDLLTECETEASE